MQNILDYLHWRGDLSFARDDLNEVDNLIFSILSYLEYDRYFSDVTGDQPLPLRQVAEILTAARDANAPKEKRPQFKQIPDLLTRAARSQRYGKVGVSSFINQINEDISEQFCAMVFSIHPKLHYIAFRGTDDTLAGWKEDFQMSFMDEVPAQKQAVLYTRQVLQKLAGDFYLGGHSKGGNLAVYAAAHTSPAMRERILAVYNNDGPGFQSKIIQSDGYQSIVDRVSTYIPRSSIVGLLLEHGEAYKVVGSSALALLQHDGFSWKVAGRQFVIEEDFSRGNLVFNEALRVWLKQISYEQRALFVDAMFEIIQASGARKLGDLSREKLVAARAMINTYKNMDAETREQLKKVIELFFTESQKIIKTSLSAEIDSFIAAKLKRKKKSVQETGQA